ncbi:MAG: hypothetical protein OES12_05010 [Anaerolineae bacterium]|nr:hypothetical protein [Anaerolineae bacterium]
MGRFPFPGQPTKQTGMVTEGTALRRIKRWQRKGIVLYERPFTDEPGYMCLTSHGLGYCLQEFSYLRPARGRYTHYYLVAAVRMALEEQHGNAISIRSERLLRKLYHVPKESGNGKPVSEPHIADLEVIKRADDGIAALEIELSLKSSARLTLILNELAARYTTTYYYCVPKTEAYVKKHIAKLPEATRAQFVVRDLTALVPELKTNPYVY